MIPLVRWSPRPAGSAVLFLRAPATPQIYTLSLHDALPISFVAAVKHGVESPVPFESLYASTLATFRIRSEEHTSELQSLRQLVCRLLLEKKNISLEVVMEVSGEEASDEVLRHAGSSATSVA